VDDDKEKEILSQLPLEVQDRLFTGFIFNDFLQAFRAFFRVEKKSLNSSIFTIHDDLTFRKYFTWNDNVYRDFMYNILGKLEPINIMRGGKIFNELEEVNEVTFI
jgi:hypothetical protein